MAYVIKINTRYRPAGSAIEYQLPGLFTESGLLLSHLKFLAKNSSKSQSWIEKNTLAVRLLIEYINANKLSFNKTIDLLRAFSKALLIGTIDPEKRVDVSGLYWKPRASDDASALLAHINNYTDYLSSQDGFDSKLINPFRKANSHEQRLNWCAYYKKQANVFLNHLAKPADSIRINSAVREISLSRSVKNECEEVYRFPEEKIQDLIEYGFINSSSSDCEEPYRNDYKNQAITFLMHYGGVRKSECFHIYLSDIILDEKNNEAIVRIYHPAEGASPKSEYRTRREFLTAEYGLLPRMEYPKTKRLHSGWKSPKLTDRRKFFEVIFAPKDKAKEFLIIWVKYLKYQRVSPPLGCDHPYAFTNSKGHPETIKNFQRMHKAAVNRIGLISSKMNGTTEHGHRHAYGKRLEEFGFSELEIQAAMHHKSPESGRVYRAYTAKEIRRKLEEIG